MAVKIDSVQKGSRSARKGLKAGDLLLSINGHEIFDVLDYRFYGDSENVLLEYQNSKGKIYRKNIRKLSCVDALGLEFSSYLMDKKQSCRNKCIFCFVDQMPPNMRETLYFKDDDSRLSFFFGNYITLTAICEREVQRIIDLHISPINISVHTMNPKLRVKMMGNPKAGEALSIIERLSEADIKMNTQLVLCPGINDGEELRFSLEELSKHYPAVQSIAAVPVGLTSFREGLYPLKEYTKEDAAKTLDIIDEFNDHFQYFNGLRLCSPADEFYIKAERPIPDSSFYGEFSQLENGVGLYAMLRDSFLEALQKIPAEKNMESGRKTVIATGEAAFPLLDSLTQKLQEKFPKTDSRVYCVKNRFFGESVTVAGLITGRDLIQTLENKSIAGSRLLLSSAMMKSGSELIFLDDITVPDVEKALSVSIQIIPETDGEALCQAILGI